jgi:hypothetical protein
MYTHRQEAADKIAGLEKERVEERVKLQVSSHTCILLLIGHACILFLMIQSKLSPTQVSSSSYDTHLSSSS